MVMYRKLQLAPPQISDDKIPDYIFSKLETEKTIVEAKAIVENENKSIIRLKVFYGIVYKIITTKRTTIYKELLIQAISEFQLSSKLTDCRLRGYNAQLQSMQETYDTMMDSTLETLHIYAFKTLALETKATTSEFDAYDPNKMSLKVNVWKEGLCTVDEEILKPEKMLIDKNCKIVDLCGIIAEKYKLKSPMYYK